MPSFGDRSEAAKLEATWDKIVEQNPATLRPPQNPYEEKIETEQEPVSSSDQNLLTAFVLLANGGLESPVGRMMGQYSESVMPFTIGQLFDAYEKSGQSGHIQAHDLMQNIKGMVVACYSWGYVESRTRQLKLRDRDIYPALAEISISTPGSEDRASLTKWAEENLPATLGLLLHARDDAIRHSHKQQQLFFEGALHLVYALAKLHFQDYVSSVS